MDLQMMVIAGGSTAKKIFLELIIQGNFNKFAQYIIALQCWMDETKTHRYDDVFLGTI